MRRYWVRGFTVLALAAIAYVAIMWALVIGVHRTVEAMPEWLRLMILGFMPGLIVGFIWGQRSPARNGDRVVDEVRDSRALASAERKRLSQSIGRRAIGDG